MLKRFLFAVAGLLLMAYGLKGPVLAVAGADAPGTVTGIKADHSTNKSGALTRNYEIRYQFAPAGSTVTEGVAYRSNVYDITTLPDTGSTVAVRYLQTLPFINLPSRDTQPDIVAFGATGFGLVLAVVGALGIGLQRGP
ncbi:MAG TPA: hypothetical protein VGK74_28010 [Symbiobacteriaceae bacterium]|jgi:hypothetical protein